MKSVFRSVISIVVVFVMLTVTAEPAFSMAIEAIDFDGLSELFQ